MDFGNIVDSYSSFSQLLSQYTIYFSTVPETHVQIASLIDPAISITMTVNWVEARANIVTSAVCNHSNASTGKKSSKQKRVLTN